MDGNPHQLLVGPDAGGLKPVAFDTIEVGEELGPLDLVVDDHYLRKYAFSVDDPLWWNNDGSPFGEPVAPAAALLADALRLLNTRFDPNRDIGLHQREEAWFASPVRRDEPVRLTGVITDKYVRRGRGVWVTEAEARSLLDNRLLLRHRATESAGIGDPTKLGGGTSRDEERPRRVVGEIPSGATMVAGPLAEVTPGMVLPPLTKRVHQAQMSVYSNVEQFWRTTHTDLATARAEGLEHTLAQGLMSASYVSELATRFFGPWWLLTGHLNIAFVAPVRPGDELVVRAVVTQVRPEQGERWIECEVWAALPDETKVCLGWIDARVPF